MDVPVLTQWRDNRGTVLVEGQTVCYNYSGQIAMGVIQEIKQSLVRRGWPKAFQPRIKIKQTHPTAGIVSTVTDQRNLMVVKEK